MKSQIIYQNKGFLIMEVMLAFSIFTLFTLSTFTLTSSIQRLKIWSVKELEKMKDMNQKIKDGYGNRLMYGNNSVISSNELLSVVHSDFNSSWGRDTCNVRLTFDQNRTSFFNQGVNIGVSNPSTDIEARHGIAYVSADSSVSSRPDFFIIDTLNKDHPSIVSSLNTGPGVAALEIAGPYAFLAETSSLNQLQIVSIKNRDSPQLISQLKLPTPTPTTTAPFANSIFYSRGYIYLGTVKWNGPEFYIIDVSNAYSPFIVGSFETNTLVNDIYVIGNRAYLATADEKQVRILDISNKSMPILIDSVSPSGWQTQEGKTIDYFEDIWALGRTTGGFNVTTNHEAFLFSTTSLITSKDIPGGVYGIIHRPSFNFLLTHAMNQELQVFDSSLVNKISTISLGNQNVKMTCDGSTLYFATGNDLGISTLQLNN